MILMQTIEEGTLFQTGQAGSTTTTTTSTTTTTVAALDWSRHRRIGDVVFSLKDRYSVILIIHVPNYVKLSTSYIVTPSSPELWITLVHYMIFFQFPRQLIAMMITMQLQFNSSLDRSCMYSNCNCNIVVMLWSYSDNFNNYSYSDSYSDNDMSYSSNLMEL